MTLRGRRFLAGALAVTVAAAVGAVFTAAFNFVQVTLAFPDEPDRFNQAWPFLRSMVALAFLAGLLVLGVVLPVCALVGERLLRRRTPRTVGIALATAALIGAGPGGWLLGGPFPIFTENLIMGTTWALVAAGAWLVIVPPPEQRTSHG